uniref:Uncharacterized protein n=1 Tax=Plectus sambesii TaxID=2011161 RepID=A0A914X152_9BILA
MSQPKRKSVYKVDFAKEFQGIKKGKEDYHAHCIPCKDEINLAAMGKTAIKQHQEKPKHKENAKAVATTRYFTASKGVQVRLLDMESLPGEDSTMVANFIIQVLGKHQLQFENLVSFCADNAPVNFGGPQLAGPNNVFKKLQEKKKNLIPVGCSAHILHNAAQKAADRVPVDIEAIVFKLASYFKGSTRRHEDFKDICNFLEVNYETIPSHGPTRWLTLGKVIDRVLKLWDPLTTLFTSKDKSPRILEEFFSSDESLPVLQFLHSVLAVFEKPLLLLQEFYTTVIEYIDKWFRVEFLPTNISWIMLSKKSVDYYDIVEMAG